MNALRIAIVDDEEDARKIIRDYLRTIAPHHTIIWEANGAKKAMEMLSQSPPNLLFLDIELGDGDGFQLLDQIGNARFKVIFITGFDEFAIKAFRYAVVDYLLKPIGEEDCREALKKAEHQLMHSHLFENLQALLEIRKTEKFDKICIASEQGMTVLKLEKIIRLEADGNYTTIFTLEGEKILSSKAIGEYEKLLSGENFYRVHNSHLVNIARIKNVRKEQGDFLILENGDKVEISRRRKDEFMAYFLQNFSKK